MHGLFSEFPGSTYADWEKQVIKDLKGESPEYLDWNNENGFTVKAYLSKDKITTVYEPAFLHSDWQVGVEHRGTEKEMNANFLRDLNHGANAIAFNMGNINLEELFKNIQLDLISAGVRLKARQAIAFKSYLDSHYKNATLNISLLPDSINNENELREWLELRQMFAAYPGINTTSVNAVDFASKNALPYFELALAFTQLIETFNISSNSESTSKVVINTSTDSDFFIQIAKLRAYRRLWKIIAGEYNINSELYILAQTDSNMLSISDVYTNLLRTTLSSMAAILGGCNELIVLPYDALLKSDSAFSSRLAMNQQFIFKHESYLDKMGDLACGSYYIESLTDSLCRKTLESIKSIESEGGYFAYLKSDSFAQEMNKQNKLKLKALEEGNTVRIGVNKFRNEKEKLELSDLQLNLLKSLAPHHPLLNYEFLQNLRT